jgi:hypothetical protein
MRYARVQIGPNQANDARVGHSLTQTVDQDVMVNPVKEFLDYAPCSAGFEMVQMMNNLDLKGVYRWHGTWCSFRKGSASRNSDVFMGRKSSVGPWLSGCDGRMGLSVLIALV